MAVVWYVGLATTRIIDSTEWTRVGAAGSTKTWDATNGWSINQSAFTSDQLTFLGALNEFTLNGAADGTPRPGSAVVAAPDSTMTLGDILEYIDLGGSAPVTLTDGATINTDAAASKHFRVTLAGNRTIANPTWGGVVVDGKTITYEIIQDATGSRTITWGGKFTFGTDVASPTLTTTGARRDFVTFQYNLAQDKWYALRVVKGYN